MGAAEDATETPELVARALREMDREINSLPDEQKRAHLRAIELTDCPPSCLEDCCYACTDYFRIRFLRSERYNPKKAAAQYCRTLSVLQEYFGDDALTKIGRAHV